jgi:hypothetical protein
MDLLTKEVAERLFFKRQRPEFLSPVQLGDHFICNMKQNLWREVFVFLLRQRVVINFKCMWGAQLQGMNLLDKEATERLLFEGQRPKILSHVQLGDHFICNMQQNL